MTNLIRSNFQAHPFHLVNMLISEIRNLHTKKRVYVKKYCCNLQDKTVTILLLIVFVSVSLFTYLDDESSIDYDIEFSYKLVKEDFNKRNFSTY